MAAVTDTIGTDARDFSTITLWEASLSAHSGDDVTGECYGDSAFDETVVIDDSTPDAIILTVASGERHDGTAGVGARLIGSANTLIQLTLEGRASVTTSWLEVSNTGASFGVTGILCLGFTADVTVRVNNCIAHGMHNDVTNGNSVLGISTPGNNIFWQVLNNIVYNVNRSAASINGCTGIKFGAGTDTSHCQNNTVFNITQDNAGSSGNAEGIVADDDADELLQNNISTTVTNAGSGTAVCYNPASPANATMDHNLASDTTASGTGSLDSKAATDQFVSTAGGSEDLHLKTGADAIDAGTDLGTTPTGVNIDIDGRDRDAEGDTWDIGAHEFVAPAAGNPWYFYANQSALTG